MKKRILIGASTIVLFLISILIIIGIKEKNKMELFFSPIEDKDKYVLYSECKDFSFEYNIKIETSPDNEPYDQITYEILIINNTPEVLKNFLPIIRFEEGMEDYLPSPFFYVEPITLYSKQPDSGLQNYIAAYSRLSNVRKISNLSEEEYKRFLDIYQNLYLEISWDKGEEKIFLNNPD